MKETGTKVAAYEEARRLHEAKDITGALKALEEGMQHNPKNPDLLNLQGLLYHLSCEFEKAAAAWQKSISMGKSGNKAKEYLTYYTSEEFRTLQEVYMEGKRSLDRKEYGKAYGIFELLHEDHKNLIGIPLKMAECAMGMKDRKRAEALLVEVLSLDHGNVLAQELLALTKKSDNTGKGGKSVPLYVMAVVLLITIGGFIYVYHHMTQELSALKLEQYSVNKELEELKEEKIRLEGLMRELEKNQNEVEPVNREENPSEEILSGTDMEIFEEGLKAYREEDYEKAVKYFLHVEEKGTIQDYRSEALYFLSAAYKKLLRTEDLKKSYDRYIEEFKNGNYYDEVLYHYGLLLQEEGNGEKAKEVLLKLQKEVPESPYYNSRVKQILEP